MTINAKIWTIHKNVLFNSYFLLVILSGLEYIVSGRPLTIRKCGTVKRPHARIVGGDFAQDGDYPWMVSLHEFYYGFDHVCGAAILNEHWIITAAHCISFPKKPQKYAIYVGVHKMSRKDRELSRKYEISQIIVHEEYDNELDYHDIAILRTKEPIDFRNSRGYVNGICLPETDEDPRGWAIVTGWGNTEWQGKNSDILKAVKVPIVPRDFCNVAYQEYENEPTGSTLLEGQLCAGTANMDSCQSDSGGPLVQKDNNGVYTLIGIVSYGYGCGLENYPGVYTKVAFYMDWLEENIQR